MSKALELRQKRAALIEQIGVLAALAGKEGRAFNADEKTKFETMTADEKALRETIENIETAEGLQRGIDESKEREARARGTQAPGSAVPSYEDAFNSYLRNGTQEMNAEYRSVLRGGFKPEETRDLSVGTNSAGGYTVPPGFRTQLVDAMKFFGGMRASKATQFKTDSGQALAMPTDNDTSNVGALLAENTADSTQDVAFGQLTFNAYKYTSKIVKISMELMNDTAFNLSAFLTQKLGQRLGRITNTHFTTGDNSSKPQGIVPGATAGVTAAGASAITYADLLGLKFSVDIAYRNNAQWMMHDTTWKAALALVDSNGRQLIQGVNVGIATGAPDTLMGQDVVINNDMATIATTAKTVLYGDLSNYWIRDVNDIFIVRFNERFADAYQVGFSALYRGDGRIVDAGTHPIKYLTQA
jgi:HK97 family phage major capsid protein